MSGASSSASCLLFTGVDQVALAEMPLPRPEPHEVLVETLFSCVSPGTELRCLAGRQDQLGADHFPFIPGYALVGRVVTADRAGRCPVGQLVFAGGTRRAAYRLAWGGHVSHAVVPADAAIVLPPKVSPVDAGLLKLAAIAYRGWRIARVRPTETVAVVGLGPIGQLSARIFAQAGVSVMAVDVSAERVATARAQGLQAVQVSSSINEVVRRVWPHGADVVVDATGRAAVLRETVQLVRDRPWEDLPMTGGKLIVQGSYSGDVPFPQDIAFAKELQVLWPRDCQREDLVAVLGLIEQGTLRVSDLAGVPWPVDQAPDVYSALQKPGAKMLTAVFAWDPH